MAYAFNDDKSKVQVLSADVTQNQIDYERAARVSGDDRLKTELNARIDNILDNQDLDPNKDSELVDIRTWSDGTVEDSAGDAVRLKANSLETWCSDISDQELIPVTLRHGYIRDNYAVGTVLTNVDNPAILATDLDLYVINCSQGDVFVLNVVGDSAARAWCFIDSNNAIISKSNSGVTLNDFVLTAPENASRLIIHDLGKKRAVFKNVPSQDFLCMSGSFVAENYIYDYETNNSYAYLDFHQSGPQTFYLRGSIHATVIIDDQYVGTMPTSGNKCVVIPYGKDVVFNLKTRQLNVVNSGSHSKYDVLLFRISNAGVLSNGSFMEVDWLNRHLQKQIDAIGSSINKAIPSYYSSHVESAISNIISNVNAGKTSSDPYPDVESFVFITDVHWNNNAQNSPSLINKIIKETPVSLVICGGDIVYSHNATKQGAISEMRDFINRIRNIGVDFHCAFGNHDDNSNGNSDIDTILPKNEQFDVLYQFNNKDKNVHFCFEDTDFTWTNPIKCDYYFDRPRTKTRFLVVDWNNPVSGSRVSWMQKVLSKNDGYRVVVIYHGIYSNATPTPEHVQIMSVLEPYKDKIVAMFCGHIHEDYISDYFGDNSIPVIFTSCDMLKTGMTRGTITEQCFDVVTIDYKNNVIKLQRVGYGNSRTVNL